jgi:hypothetical protein
MRPGRQAIRHGQGYVMRSLYVAAVAAVIAATPAFAQSPRKPPYASPPTSHDVYGATGWIGRDPDPNVRFEIMRQQNWRKGG